MKSTREPFDKELRRRLLNYTEEPGRLLWQNIVPRIVSVNPEPRWVVWTSRFSVFIIGVAGLLFFTTTVRKPLDNIVHQTTSTSPPPVADRSKAQVLFDPDVAFGAGEHDTHARYTDTTDSDIGPGAYKQQGALISSSLSSVPRNLGILQDFEEPDRTEVSPKNLADNSGLLLRDTTRELTLVRKRTLTARQEGENSRSTPSSRAESQTSSKVEQERRPFSLYFTAMPTLGYQRIKSNNTDNIFIAGIERIPTISMERLGVRLEAGAEVPLSKRWKAFGGMVYYQRNQTIGYIERGDTIVASGPEAERTFEPQYEYLSKSIEYELKNVGLQVGLSYQLRRATQKATSHEGLPSLGRITVKEKLLHEVGAGIEFHKSLRNTRTLESAEGFSDPSTYVFLNMYYRLQYPNTGRLRAIFQPTLNYSFYINENLNAPFYVKPYGLGLNFGCKYHFR